MVASLANADLVSVSSADLTLTGAAAFDRSGQSLAPAYGFFQSARPAIVIGGYLADAPGIEEAGSAYVFDGLLASGTVSLDMADFTVEGSDAEGAVGFCVTGGGDLNDDGFGDLAVGGWSVDGTGGFDCGVVAIFFGADTVSGTLSIDDADILVYGQDPEDHLGWCVDLTSDFNDDGVADLIVGASLGQTDVVSSGEVFVFFGSSDLTSGTVLDPALANVHFRGVQVAAGVGQSLAVGDITGDGVADLFIGAPGQDTAGRFNNGAVYAYVGGPQWNVTSTVDVGNAFDAALIGAASNDSFGMSVALSNLDDDGDRDVLVGAPFNSQDAPNAGRAYVFSGGPIGSPVVLDAATDATTVLGGDTAGDLLGFAIADGGDFNADGTMDMIVGAPGDDPDSNASAGSAYLFYGQPGSFPSTGLASAVANRQFTGIAPGDELGAAVRVVRDLNQDGSFDVVLGAPGADVGGLENAGTTYLFTGGEIVGVADVGSPRFSAAPPRPLPARSRISVALAVPGSVREATVSDAAGRTVRTLRPGSTAREIQWDLRSARGARVPAGVYFLRLEGDAGRVETLRVVVAR